MTDLGKDAMKKLLVGFLTLAMVGCSSLFPPGHVPVLRDADVLFWKWRPIRYEGNQYLHICGVLANRRKESLCVKLDPSIGWGGFTDGHIQFSDDKGNRASNVPLEVIRPNNAEPLCKPASSGGIQMIQSQMRILSGIFEEVVAIDRNLTIEEMRSADWDIRLMFPAFRKDKESAIRLEGRIPGTDLIGDEITEIPPDVLPLIKEEARHL